MKNTLKTNENINIDFNKIKSLFILLLSSLLFCTGCSENEDLANYKSSMQEFTDEIQGIINYIDSIDPNSPESTQQLLSSLDEMDAAFTSMAALEVPEQFANNEDLADEASANMSRAVSLYHQAFDTVAGYDPSVVDAAKAYYDRAFRRISYIGTILQGQIPQDEHVTIIRDGEEPEINDSENGENTGETPTAPQEE